MNVVDYIFWAIAAMNIYLIICISQWTVAYYQAKRFVPNAIFDQFHGEMTFPRQIVYAKFWRSLDTRRMPTPAGKNGNLGTLVYSIIILAFLSLSVANQYYYQRSSSALATLPS